MKTRLYREYINLKERKKYSRNFSKILKKDLELNKFIIEESKLLDLYYPNPTPLQRLKFIFEGAEIKLCECGNPLGWRDFYNENNGYNKTCGNKKCISKKNLESVRIFYKNNLGVDHIFQTEDFKEKLKNTFIKKYGVDNPGKSEEIKQKIRDTNIKKFGESNWLKVKENREHVSKKIIDNNNLSRIKKIKEKNIPIEILKFSSDLVMINCNVCGNESSFSNSFFNKKMSISESPCLTCNPPLYSDSKGENELLEFISSKYKGKIKKHERDIAGKKEIDIYLPELKIGFEFDGLWWHSEVFRDKNYNINKKISIENSGISLYNIWEDLWEYKGDIVKSRICNVLGLSKKIFARKCEIRLVSVSEEKKFLNENHIQGYTPSKIKIGLYQNNDLVSLMTFGSKRISLGQKPIESEYELLRFCNKLNISVIGGASKIFSFFIRKYNPQKIISYQDNAWHTGNLYKNLGFDLISDAKSPNYWWCKGNIRFHRFNFRKDKLIKDGYDPNKTEDQIMTERNYFKLWDFGNRKWEYTKKA